MNGYTNYLLAREENIGEATDNVSWTLSSPYSQCTTSMWECVRDNTCEFFVCVMGPHGHMSQLCVSVQVIHVTARFLILVY